MNSEASEEHSGELSVGADASFIAHEPVNVEMDETPVEIGTTLDHTSSDEVSGSLFPSKPDNGKKDLLDSNVGTGRLTSPVRVYSCPVYVNRVRRQLQFSLFDCYGCGHDVFFSGTVCDMTSLRCEMYIKCYVTLEYPST